MSEGVRAAPRQKPTQVKALIVDLSKRYGGASTRAVGLARALQDWGVAIAALDGSPVAIAAKESGLPVLAIARHKWDPRIPFRLAAACHSGFELLDTQNIQAKVWASLAAVLSGAALVSTLNSWYAAEHGGSLKGAVYAALERLTQARTDLTIAVSNGIRDALCEAGFPGDIIEVIHNGIEPLPARAGNEDAVRACFGLPESPLVCTAVGRLVWAKGYGDLIEAFALIADRVPRLRCVIVGEGELGPELERKIAQAGLSGRCVLVGFRAKVDVLRILRASDLFAMPSRSEGIPYALLEAGALGLPIVASRCGGIPEVVTDGVEALLVEPGDVQGIATALERLCADRDVARQLGERARQRIERDFSLEATAAATKAAYIRALQHRRAR